MPIEFQQIPEAQLKQEALNAMRALHLQEDIISTFEKTGAIMMTKAPYEKATLLDDEATTSVEDSQNGISFLRDQNKDIFWRS